MMRRFAYVAFFVANLVLWALIGTLIYGLILLFGSLVK